MTDKTTKPKTSFFDKLKRAANNDTVRVLVPLIVTILSKRSKK